MKERKNDDRNIGATVSYTDIRCITLVLRDRHYLSTKAQLARKDETPALFRIPADESITALQRAIKLNNPDFVALAHINLGLVYAQMNRRAQAIAALKQAVALNPQFVKARIGLCELYLALEQNAEAVACYKALPVVPSDAKAHTNFGIALVRFKRYQEAIVVLEETTRRFPTHAEAYNVLGSVLTESKHYKEAIVALSRALELDPSHYAAHYNLAVAQFAMKNRAAALEQYALLRTLKAALAQQLYEIIYGNQLLFANRK